MWRPTLKSNKSMVVKVKYKMLLLKTAIFPLMSWSWLLEYNQFLILPMDLKENKEDWRLMFSCRPTKKMSMLLVISLVILSGILEKQLELNTIMKLFIKVQLQLWTWMARNSLLIIFLSSGQDNITTPLLSLDILEDGMIFMLLVILLKWNL